MPESGIVVPGRNPIPDSAALHPGYAWTAMVFMTIEPGPFDPGRLIGSMRRALQAADSHRILSLCHDTPLLSQLPAVAASQLERSAIRRRQPAGALKISHDQLLAGPRAEVQAFLDIIAPLEDVLGPPLLHLPTSFGPEYLGNLWRFVNALPAPLNCTVEVRHIALLLKPSRSIINQPTPENDQTGPDISAPVTDICGALQRSSKNTQKSALWVIGKKNGI